MKILKIGLTVLVLLGFLLPTIAWGDVNISVDESQSREGIRVWVKKPPEIAENPDLRLWVRPKEKKLVLQNSGEFIKAYFKLFSEGPNKIIVEALEEVKGNLEETDLVKILTPTVEIQENEGVARIVVVLPDEPTKSKYHFVVQFLCKGKLLAQANIWLEIPPRFKQFTRIEGSVNGITAVYGIRNVKDDWQIILSCTHDFSSNPRGPRVSVAFRKDL